MNASIPTNMPPVLTARPLSALQGTWQFCSQAFERLAGLALCALLAACAAPTAAPAPPVAEPPTPTATATPSHIPDPTPTPTPSPTASPPPTTTPTPAPTLSPQAITASTIERLEAVLTLEGGGGAVLGVAVSADGRLVASGSFDRRVRVFDGQSGELLHTLERHQRLVHSVDLSPDGSRLVSGSRDRTFQLWDPLAGERIGGSRASGEVLQVAFAPDGERFAGVGYYSALGEVWSAEDGAPLFLLEGHHTRLRSVAWSPDGRWLATGDESGEVVLHDPTTGAPLETFQAVQGEALALAFSPDGATLAVGSSRGVLALWALDGLRELASWPAHSTVTGVRYSPDGSLLISSGREGAIMVWDAVGLSRLGDGSARAYRLAGLGRHGASVRGIDISQDGATLVSGGDDGRVFVWRLGATE